MPDTAAKGTNVDSIDDSRSDSKHSRTSSSDSTDGVLLSIANLRSSRSDMGNSAAPSTAVTSESSSSEPDVTIEDESEVISKLRLDLKDAKKQLKIKDDEIKRLSDIRDNVEAELEELTASLFEEAHKMVREANDKQVSAEKSATEAKMKIEGLTSEVVALKDMVLTSTPAHPNKHLHPQICPKSSKKKNGKPVKSEPPKLPVVEPYNDRNHIDPTLLSEYLLWREKPSLDRPSHPFLRRLYTEDIDLALNFHNRALGDRVGRAIHENGLTINPIPKTESQKCALLEEPFTCKYRVKLFDEEEEFYISHLSRNRIIAVCDCLNYLRYVTQGLVKSPSEDVYWEIMQLRKKILLARLGFEPD